MPSALPEPTLLAGIDPKHHAAWAAGRIERSGVLLRDVETKRIVGHYQPSAELSRQAAEAAAAGSPLSPAMGLSGESLQLLGVVGSAASVLNLAVTVGGFALVLNRLSRLDDKVDVVLDKLSEIQTRLDRRYKIGALTAARRSEEAFQASPAEQRRVWGEAEAKFDEAVTHFFHDVIGESLVGPDSADGPVPVYDRLSLQESLALLDWLTFCGRGRIEALYLLGEPARAAEFAGTLSGWLGQFEVRPDAYLDHRLGGRVVSDTLRAALRAEGETAHQLVSEWHGYAEHTRESAQALHDHGVDTNRFVRETRDYPEAALLYLPLGELPEDIPEAEKSVGRDRARS